MFLSELAVSKYIKIWFLFHVQETTPESKNKMNKFQTYQK